MSSFVFIATCMSNININNVFLCYDTLDVLHHGYSYGQPTGYMLLLKH